MGAIPNRINPLGFAKSSQNVFTLTVKPGILTSGLTYGFTPQMTSGGYCKVLDWGDGASQDAVVSGSLLVHTYASAGTYKIRIQGNCYRCVFGNNAAYRNLVFDSNGNWEALGNITNGSFMFADCANAVLTFSQLPSNLITGSSMFKGCSSALLPITGLPSVLTTADSMFNGCSSALLYLTELPSSLMNAKTLFNACISAHLTLSKLPPLLAFVTSMFNRCLKLVCDLDTLASNAGTGWSNLTDIQYMFYQAGSGNTPGTVTGSQTAFLAKCPNATSSAYAFTRTNTTV